MLRVDVEQLAPGMTVGRAVIGQRGQVLLTAGTRLTDRYIRLLRRLGVPAIYIAHELAPDITADPLVSEPLHLALTAGFQELTVQVRRELEAGTRSVTRHWHMAVERVRQAVNDVVDELMANPHAVYNLADIQMHDAYTLTHSVNVCILSVLTGMSLGYNASTLRDLGLAGALHDIGKVAIPAELLNKAEPLTPEELQFLRQHTTRGWEILRRQSSLSLFVAHTAWQHHERWSGGGYPRGLRGAEIIEFGRVVAVADCYDAMTADRPYRRAMTPERAVANLSTVMSGWFEPRILNHFLDRLAPYPVGSLVRLSTQETAVVSRVEYGRAVRPTVRVVLDPRGQRVPPFDVDLSRDPYRTVAAVLRLGGDGADPERMAEIDLA